MKKPRKPDGAEALERLKNLTRQIVAVPKAEVDERAKQYQEAKKRRVP